MRIGELAKQCGLTADTIRFYESRGLLPAARRSNAGYRLYDENSGRQLRFIGAAKSVGFSLQGVQELLSIRLEKGQRSCADVKLLTQTKLEDIRMKIDELQRMEAALKQIHDDCCGGDEPANNCSILSALERGDA